MPRYIDADAFLERMKRTPRYFDIKHDVEQIPTADVVPKSEADNLIKVIDNTTQQFLELHDLYQNEKREVERLENILNSYALQYGTVTDQHKVIENIKAEVAREVIDSILSKIRIMIRAIEEVERRDNSYYSEFNGGAKTALEIVFKDIAELEKKYTEGNDENI